MSYSVVIEVPECAVSIHHAKQSCATSFKDARNVVVHCPRGVPNARIRKEVDDEKTICVSMDRVLELTTGQFLVHLPHNAFVTLEAKRRLFDEAVKQEMYEQFSMKPMLTVYDADTFNPFHGYILVMVLLNWIQSLFSWNVFRCHELSTEVRLTVITKSRGVRKEPKKYWFFKNRHNARYMRSFKSVIEYPSKGLDCVMRALRGHESCNGVLVDLAFYFAYVFFFGYPITNVLFWSLGHMGSRLMTPLILSLWIIQAFVLFVLTPMYVNVAYWYVYILAAPIYVLTYPVVFLISKYAYRYHAFEFGGRRRHSHDGNVQQSK